MGTEPYTPTTEEVAEAWEYHGEGMDFSRVRKEQRESFDRWLAGVKRDAAAEAQARIDAALATYGPGPNPKLGQSRWRSADEWLIAIRAALRGEGGGE